MSDSDDEANIPAREVCEQRCQEFAQVTGTDTALAMFYLQDRDWDLQRSLNAFFEGNASPKETSNATNLREAAPFDDPEPHRIRLLSWNIDGLDQNNLATRMKGVCGVINKEKPDVIFLQEVIAQTESLLEELCPQYQLISGDSSGYYTAILLRCDTVVYADHKIIPFYTSKMGRNILHVKARVKSVDINLMTTHLESTKSHSAERKRQLKTCFNMMADTDLSNTVLFGGDLNLRDNELADLGGVPEGVYDIWEVTGKRPDAKFTWDCMRNDNLEMSGKFKPRARFDRIYVHHPRPKPKVKPVYFELVGIERLTKCGRFPSDHWGLLSHYDKI